MELKKSVLIKRGQFDESLKNSPEQGKRLLDPLKTFTGEQGVPLNILEDHQVSNDAEVHRHEDDLWYCLEGEVTFVYGGELVEPWAKEGDDREIKAKEITNGTESLLTKGDWLYIPAGQPHSHRTEGTARLVIIKLPAKEEVPLEAVPGWGNK